MKEINIAKTIINRRKEKGITQEDLADYMGVSKASVSKWETGQSYPDITLLPKLAAYFNISIDELMNYSPQMVREDIRKLYHRLAKDFSEKPFEEVYEECIDITKKYYSCFPLLSQICVLFLNHYMMAATKERQEEILENTIEICLHISQESGDTVLSSRAEQIQGMCLMILGRPAETIDLIQRDEPFISNSPSSLLANAYIATGKIEKAEEVLQADLYGQLMALISQAPLLIHLNMGKPDKVKVLIDRMFTIVDTFEFERLNFNAVLLLCLSSAQAYMVMGDSKKAMEYLTRYTDICCNLQLPMMLHGDDFFDRIDDLLQDLDMGAAAPRDEKLVRESMVDALVGNPAFASLADLPEFKNLLVRLRSSAS